MKKNIPSKLKKLLKEQGKLEKIEKTPKEVLIQNSLMTLEKINKTFSKKEKEELKDILEKLEKGGTFYVDA